MKELIQEFLVVSIIIFSIFMIYFFFKNKSKKYKNMPTLEMHYISRLYGIDLKFIGIKKLQIDTSIVNAIIVTIDLLILYHIKNTLVSIIIIIITTFVLIPILYHILGKNYQRLMYRGWYEKDIIINNYIITMWL